MIENLFETLEADDIAVEVYLASTTEWLYRWIGRIPEVVELEKLARNNQRNTRKLVKRTFELFDSPIEPGYRSEHEPALCCYAYVLYQLDNEEAQRAMNVLDRDTTYSYGWLRQILDRSLKNASTVDWSGGNRPFTIPRIFSFGSTVPITAKSEYDIEIDSVGFDDLSEAWSLENDYVEVG
jgi:hypothetical protein